MLRAIDTIAKSDTGRQRKDNEDSAFARAPVFVVADGMGGAQAGEVASRIAVEAFEQGLPEGGTVEERLVIRAQEANVRIHELSQTERELGGMGTTLTAAYLDDSGLVIAHVGDSRAYLFRGDELKRLTKDHSLVEELVDRGKLTAEQAAEHPQRSIITRALGPEATVQVDTWTYPVRAGDVLLLCSDGLTSMISDEAVSAVLSKTSELQAAAQMLIDEANAAGGRDNITVVLFRVEEADVSAGDGSSVEQPTIVGARAATVPSLSAIPPPAPPPGVSEAASSVAEPAPAQPRLARRQGRDGGEGGKGRGGGDGTAAPAAGPRRRRRYITPVAALIAVVIVLFLIGGGGYLASRQLYFIGTNSEGIVTIFRGLPYSLPAGIHLYESYYVSGVPASEVPATRRGTLLNHHLRSQSDASTVVRDLELGRISQ